MNLYISFSSHCNKIPDRNNLKEERFILTQDSGNIVYHGKGVMAARVVL